MFNCSLLAACQMPNHFKRFWFLDEDDSFLVSLLSYLSIFSGTFLSMVFGSLITIFPIHNVMFEPQYWYEDRIVSMCAAFPMVAQNLLGNEYWCDLRYKKRYLTYFLMGLQCFVIYPFVIIGFYFVWVVAMQYFPPLPMCQHLGGTNFHPISFELKNYSFAIQHDFLGTIIAVAMNTTLWFR